MSILRQALVRYLLLSVKSVLACKPTSTVVTINYSRCELGEEKNFIKNKIADWFIAPEVAASSSCAIGTDLPRPASRV